MYERMDQQFRMAIRLILVLLIPKTARGWLKLKDVKKKIFEVVLAVLNPHVSAIKHHSASWQRKSPLLRWRWLIKQRPQNLLTISYSQQLHHDWTACGGMSWSMEINLNYWDRGGGGGGGAGDGREWKGECAFDLGENWSQACRYCVCGGQQHRQQADISERARGLVFRDPPHRALALFIG